jgi:hypothetical protein
MKKEFPMTNICTPKLSSLSKRLTENRSTAPTSANIITTHRERLILVEQLPEFLGNKARIRLQGRWLTAAGFLPRTHAKVRVMTGCLVITTE